MYIELDDYATNRVMNNFDPETQVILFAVEDGISPYNDPLDVTTTANKMTNTKFAPPALAIFSSAC